MMKLLCGLISIIIIFLSCSHTYNGLCILAKLKRISNIVWNRKKICLEFSCSSINDQISIKFLLQLKHHKNFTIIRL
jgi:hypothetical protein